MPFAKISFNRILMPISELERLKLSFEPLDGSEIIVKNLSSGNLQTFAKYLAILGENATFNEETNEYLHSETGETETKVKDKYYIYEKTDLNPENYGWSAYEQFVEIESFWKAWKKPFTIKEILPYSLNNETIFLERLNSNIEQLLTSPKVEAYFNNKCNTHVSDISLFSVTETLLLESGCTDTLQSKLKDGWRILSICPQPDQRRPDYILGR
jgi:hypothetical protein